MVNKVKVVFKLVSGFILLCTLVLFAIGYYLDTHKQEIFTEFKKWYSSHYNGTITFDNISVGTFKKFPSVSFTVENIILTNEVEEKGKTETIKIKEVNFNVSFQKLLKNEVQFKSVQIKNGSFNLVTNKIDLSKKTITPISKKDSTKVKSSSKWFSESNTKITIENIEVSILDYINGKRIISKINKITTVVKVDNEKIEAQVNMNVFMNEMGLNLQNGTFFNGVNVSGKFNSVYNRNSKEFEVPFFNLKMDNQVFKVKADINIGDGGTFYFVLENQHTVVKPTIALLSQNIQKKLKKYKVSKPIYTYTTLQGNFKHGSNPFVNIKGATNNNSINIGGVQLHDVEFKGDFFNRLYEDKRAETENKKDLTLRLNTFKSKFKNIAFSFSKFILKSSPEALNYFDFVVESKGEASTLNSLFNNEAFLFRKGNFDIKTVFKGDVSNIDSLFVKTNSILSLGKSEVYYEPLLLIFPIDTLQIELNNKNAILNILSIPINEKGNTIKFSGDITNATSLVFKNKDLIQTKFDLKSDVLTWEDFTELFRSEKTEEAQDFPNKPKMVLDKALKGIYNKFNPSLNIVVDQFSYNNFNGQNLKTGFYFKGENNLYLEETSFNYYDGHVNMSVDLDISDDDKTVFDLIFDTDKIDFGILLKEFNYFELKSLQDIEKLAGDITMVSDFKGILDNETGLDTELLKGKVYLELENVEIKGFKPLEKVANKVFRKKRFEDIKFAPIIDTLYIANRTIEIPRLQIQSTAIDLFVEGHLSYDDKTNIWVTIPLSNLKHRNVNEIPELKAFENTGKKIFVEVKEKIDGELEYKLHLNDKKLYEEKGILEQYKIDHKNERKSRRAYKKNERRLKRESVQNKK